MSTPPDQAPAPVFRWNPLFPDETSFRARIKENDTSRTPTEEDLKAHEHGLLCWQCQNLLILEPCVHCGGTHFVMQLGSYQRLGLYCRSCTRAYSSTQCPSCQTVIPLSHKVLMQKTIVEPAAAGALVRWIGFAVVAAFILVILFSLF